MTNFKVSIIIPTYNRAHLLGETLDSVLAQIFQNWECIVIDDRSTDVTNELMEFYCAKDNRIKYYHRPKSRPKGASVCRNFGLEKANGVYIQFLDADDLIGPDKLNEQVLQLKENKDELIIACKWGRFYTTKKLNVYQSLRVYQKFENLELFFSSLSHSFGFFPPHAYLVKKDLIFQAGNWNENLSLNDDTEFFFRLLLKAGSIGFCENAQVYYRCPDENNLSAFNSESKVRNGIKAWKLISNYFEIYFDKNLIFLEKEKLQFYSKLKNTYPKLIHENGDFFSKQIKEDKRKKSLIRKLKRKLKSIIKV